MRDSTDAGSAATSTAGTKRPRTLSQKRLVAKIVDHHLHHRASVRRLIPSTADSLVTAAFEGPRTSADASTTTAPTYTLRPRKRTDGGVHRRRQPSAAQQKLVRTS